MMRILNLTLLLFSSVALFFVFTSGVPLIEWGLVEHWGTSKKPYVRTTRYAFLALVGLWAISYFVLRKRFTELGVVHLVRRITQMPFKATLSALFLIYISVMSLVGYTRHQAMETRAFDLGIFAQAVWNTTQGDFLYSSIKGGICLMGDHVSPVLLTMTPLYMLWADPRILLIAQAIAAGSCVFMIAAIARDKLQSQGAALVFALMYLMYFPTRAALHEDFHPEVLVEPFILLSFIFLEKKRIKSFLLCLFVVVLGKENMLGISFVLGFYAWVFKGFPKLGISIMALSVATFFFNILWLVPQLSGQEYLYQGSYKAIASGQAGNFLKHLFSGDSFEYLAKVFLPFLFMPFFHFPTLILAAPIFFQNLLSENEVMRSFNYHYTTGMTPFVFISCIYGFHTLTTKFPVLGLVRPFILAGIFVASLVKSGASEYYYYWQSREKITSATEKVRERLRAVPSHYSVLTHNNFIPQLVNRKEVHQFDYTPTYSKADLAKKHNVDYVIMDGDFWEEGTEPLDAALGKLVIAGYRVDHNWETFYVMKRETSE